MANSFSKEERVAFEEVLEGFNDAMVLANHVTIKNTNQKDMERSSDVMWIPQPYIVSSYDGADQSDNFKQATQLSVPATIGFEKSVPWSMTSKELRDSLQEKSLGVAAKQKLASDVNRAVMDVAAFHGSLFVKRTAAASGFSDVAEIESVMNEQGIPMDNRYLALSTRDYNSMASDLVKSDRSFGNSISDSALRRAYVGQLASFETYKLDYAVRKTAAAGSGITVSTLPAAVNYWVPKSRSVAPTGEASNVDNRFQTLTVSSTTGVAPGDSFTIANVFSVHHITKESTGQLKTFRVVSVSSGTTMVITPAIVSGQGGSPAEAQYQNVSIAATSGSAPIVFLNTAAGAMNPFWHKDSIALLPGKKGHDQNSGASFMTATTDQGVPLVMTKQFDIKTDSYLYRMDTFFGVVNLQPQMSGIIMFGQP